MTPHTTRTKYFSSDAMLRHSYALTEQAVPHTEFEAHIHVGEIEFYHFLDGNLCFIFEDKQIPVEPGSFFLLCNNLFHRPIIKKECRYERKHIFIKKEAFTHAGTGAIALYNRLHQKQLIVVPPEIAAELGLPELWCKIEHAIQKGAAYEDFCALNYCFSFLIDAERVGLSHENARSFSYHEKAAELLQYIHANLTEDLSYKALSEKFCMSEKTLYKFFKREVGFPLSQYILTRRIMKAQAILNAGGTAAEAARNAGFGDYTVFYRSFCKEVGMTPTEYIKQQKRFSTATYQKAAQP